MARVGAMPQMGQPVRQGHDPLPHRNIGKGISEVSGAWPTEYRDRDAQGLALSPDEPNGESGLDGIP